MPRSGTATEVTSDEMSCRVSSMVWGYCVMGWARLVLCRNVSSGLPVVGISVNTGLVGVSAEAWPVAVCQ